MQHTLHILYYSNKLENHLFSFLTCNSLPQNPNKGKLITTQRPLLALWSGSTAMFSLYHEPMLVVMPASSEPYWFPIPLSSTRQAMHYYTYSCIHYTAISHHM